MSIFCNLSSAIASSQVTARSPHTYPNLREDRLVLPWMIREDAAMVTSLCMNELLPHITAYHQKK